MLFRSLVTSPERLALLRETLPACRDLRHIVILDSAAPLPTIDGLNPCRWRDLLAAPSMPGHRVIDTDVVSILYTSGSTGKPKGVVLSHRNMVAGAKSVASYLENRADDTLLAALPLSFDAGFSQLTTAFHVGARVVLLNYLLPRDVLKAADLAHNFQEYFTEVVCQLARSAAGLGLSKNLAFAGGCALNSAANGRLVRASGFEVIFFIQGSPGAFRK